MRKTNQEIHQAVKDRYGQIAARASAPECCCAGSSCDCSTTDTPVLYDERLLAGLPVDASGLSLGCGDPVTLASLQPGERVLDLGSGAGMDCFLAARQVGTSGHVVGVDMTPQMLTRAEASRAQLGLSNVEFRHGQIEALPVEDGSVDVVISNCVINLSPDKQAVFREVYRVLRPGGRFSISDIVTEGEFTAEQRADLASWADCVSGAVDAELYIRMLRDAGFADVQVLNKLDAEGIVQRQAGMPRLFSARLVGRKPG